ncbi:uncharacterized protein LOC129756406 [Uranotaenia lowii]|uniref:uncharacterized protein LOC129756406 n=1 Tax=Uranotaenia lowii TaxID=190385 RepID=UPI00247B12C1|nr:uncharacterized protein LOC129756406 [Uranotaenia lowii]
MGKKGKKNKGPKLTAEQQQEILQTQAAEKWGAQQALQVEKDNLELKQYNQRRVTLVETLKQFRRIEKAATEWQKQQQKKSNWAQYLKCEKLPNPASAAELRGFLYRWSYELEENARNFTSWTMDVNERSPLTQDDSLPLETMRVCRDRNKNFVAGRYLPGIRNALQILTLIDDSFRHEQPQAEVVKARDEIRSKIADVIQEITTRVGGNIWRDMTALDEITAEFSFSSDILCFYLWSFRDVPLPPLYNYLAKSFSMSSLQTELHRPLSLDLKEAMLQGYWSGFDHYSDLDPTFQCGLAEQVPDLIASQEMEWADRNRLREQALNKMKSVRQKYEADLKQRELELAEAAGKSTPGAKPGPAAKQKGAKKKGKKGKAKNGLPAVPPPIVTSETTVDIDAEYLTLEWQQYQEKMERIGPNSLNLPKGYINLRSHRLTGGLLTFRRLCKLPQPSEMRTDFLYTTLPLGLKLTEKVFVSESDSELIKFDIQLRSECFWWNAPVVCTWEYWEQSEDFFRYPIEMQQAHLNKERIEEEESKKLFSAPKIIKNPHKITFVRDINLTDVPVSTKLHFLIKDLILPRLPDGYKFFAELHALYLALKKAFVGEQKILIEKKLNEMLYKEFHLLKDLDAESSDQPQEQFELPDNKDVGGTEKTAPIWGPLISTEIPIPVEALLYDLKTAQQEPAYLFAPNVVIPCVEIIEKSFDVQESNFQDLLQKLFENIPSEDPFSSDAIIDLLSNFMQLLHYLREVQQPIFPEPPEEEQIDEERRDTSRRRSSQQRVSRQTSRMMALEAFLKRFSKRVSSIERRPKPKKKRRKSMQASFIEDNAPSTEYPSLEDDRPVEIGEHPIGRWSTKNIQEQEYDPVNKRISFTVDRLGIFGIATEKYYNLPFRSWDMRKTGKASDLTVTVTLDCTAIQVLIHVRKSGYRIEFQQAPQPIVPPKGELSLEDLEKQLHRMNLIIFPEQDAQCYLQGQSSPKQDSMELHNLKCMAIFCLTHNFSNCFWNKFSGPRDALIQCRQLIDGRQEPAFGTVLMNPRKAATVTVEELCSPLDQILLEYHPVPDNQPYNPDVYNLLKDTLEEPSRKLLARTPPLLQWNVAQLLQKLRLCSFS